MSNLNNAWTRRKFVAAAGAASLITYGGQPSARADEGNIVNNEPAAIDFPSSFLYCVPTNSGIWVRVQLECRGCLTDLSTGQTNEYVMGVMAKTGLSPVNGTEKIAPGYDYTIIFSKSHVFTKRSHSSAYLNNPTVLEHRNFGEASWRLHQAPAKPLRSVAEVRQAIADWRRMSAKTTFTSADGARKYSVEYPIKWADYSSNKDGFRVETGPIFLMNPDKLRVGDTPQFEDFHWAHVDFHSFDHVRCIVEQPTSILADATFAPPAEDGREKRATAAFTENQVEAIRDALHAIKSNVVPQSSIDSLLTTDHYSLVSEKAVTNELYSY